MKASSASAADQVKSQDRSIAATGTDRDPQTHSFFVRTLGWGNPRINLSAGEEIVTEFVGSASQKRALVDNIGQPLALASADFDEDGMPDLVIGFATPEGGAFSIQRGNVDALFPNAPEAKQRKVNKQFTELPFLSLALVIDLPERPDFIGAGDFDADGHSDVITAQHGSDRLYFLRGDGHGSFAAPVAIQLPGRVTAFVTGEINRADGLTDVVVSIDGPDGSKVMVFESPEGAMRAKPEIFSVSTTVTSLALGHLNGNFLNDLAIAAGGKLLIVNGRDRRLSLDETRQAEVPDATIDEIQLPFLTTSMAAGRFLDDHRTDLALLSSDGSIHIFAHIELNAKDSKTAPRWQQAKTVTLSASLATGGNSPRLVITRSASLPVDSLVVVDPLNRTLHVLADTTSLKANPVLNKQAGVDLLPEITSTSLEVDGEPMAVLPMRVNASALSGLIILRKDHNLPVVVSPQASMTFTVTNTNDSGPGSLRQAIFDAFANPGLDRISFNIGTGPKTISPSSALPEIDDPVILDGTTQPGYAGLPIIEINGTSISFSTGIIVNSGNSTVRGLVINSFTVGYGIKITNSGGNIIEQSFLGTNTSGSTSLPNAAGVYILNSPTNTVGGTVAAARNVLSGNRDAGVRIDGSGSSGNRVLGNLIGTNSQVTGGLPNAYGFETLQSENSVVGGTTAGARNIISGNVIGAILDWTTSGNLVQGNFFGTGLDGSSALPNQWIGIQLIGNSNIIGGIGTAGRNVISGNGDGGTSSGGIFVFGSSNLVQGNYIGTDSSGSAGVPNHGPGIQIGSFAANNNIGGIAAGTANVISGNSGEGVSIYGQGASGNQIQGNLIGVNSTGTTPLSNRDGVVIYNGTNTLIGGTTAGARNVISGNEVAGIEIETSVSVNNLVQGNFIGTNASGNGAIGNVFGVVINDAPDNIIGGVTSGSRNVVSGNSNLGISVVGANAINNTIQGNYIGTDSSGNFAIPNGFYGISLQSSMTMIGGVAQGAGNTIAFNQSSGVIIQNTSGLNDSIRGNSIYANSGLGIDLGGNGSPIPNDSCDPDTGPNNLQNYPLLNSALASSSGISILGTLNSTSNTTFSVDFFSNQVCDPSGYGEGQTFLGTANVTTDGSCNANLNVTLPTPVTPGFFLTATATDPSGNTSEFSQCRVVTGCLYSISPLSQSVTWDWNAISVSVTATAGCSWTAVSNVPWILVSSAGAGTGNGTANFTVGPNDSSIARTGTMTIAGKIFTVTQDGAPCIYSISPTSQSVVAAGGTMNFAVNCPGGCSWTATPNAPWLSIIYGGSGVGFGTLQVIVSANNSTNSRTGTITLGGQTITINQSAAAPNGSQVNLTIPPAGASSMTTPGTSGSLQTGYATLTANSSKTGSDRWDAGASLPYGVAVFSLTQNGVVVSEAGVPASPPTTRARIFIDYRTNVPAKTDHTAVGTVNIDTGLAIVNRGSANASLTFTLRDALNNIVATGNGFLAQSAHRALFLDQLSQLAPNFVLPANFATAVQFGSLEISSNQPVSILALRSTINQRGETLITSTPIADMAVSSAAGPLYFPQVADGGGFITGLFLLNTSAAVETGVIHTYRNDGSPLLLHRWGDSGSASSTFNYTIQPAGVYVFLTDGAPTSVNTGSVQVIPDASSPTPVGAGVFSYSTGGVLVSESGIPTSTPTTHARIYIDRTAGHNTGLAVAAPSAAAVQVTLTAYQPDGVTLVGSNSVSMNGNGHDARFANELIPALGEGYAGVLDLSAPSPFVALTLRSLTNARGDFLMTTFPIADFNQAAPWPAVFPQMADGGGYRTQFILLNPSAGAANMTLSYFGDNGAPLPLTKTSERDR
ncbi:MAG: FG-GAP-like repeat-containing protein [Acidobacteriia bacterium]|nr:FG-GAP-like repeat-containing protein [Terriglobia bacterium]